MLTDKHCMPFGRHKDWLMEDLPEDYLNALWFVIEEGATAEGDEVLDYIRRKREGIDTRFED